MWRIVMVSTVARVMFRCVIFFSHMLLVLVAADVVETILRVVVFAYSLASMSAAAVSIIASAPALSIVTPRTGLLNQPCPLYR